MKFPDGRQRHKRKSLNIAGEAHELTFSCYQGLPLLSKDRSRRWLLEGLSQARETHDLELWAYVIMPNHAHVLLASRRANYDISAVLKSIKQSVSRKAIRYLKIHSPDWLNRLRVVRSDGRLEHRFWQRGGGYDRNIIEPSTAWACVDYIHQNPIRKGLVDLATDWPWSSAGWYAGLDDALLEMDTPPDPISR